MHKIGLVLEGGGMRGAYTAGALAWLNDNDIYFDYHVGISSGAAYLCCYLMNDKHTPYNMAVHYATDKQVVGWRAFLNEGHYVAYHRIFDEFLKKQEGMTIQPLKEADVSMEVGVYDMELGKTVWYGPKDLDDELDLLRGTCALPIASAVVEYKGRHLLDGGVTVMIPIERSMEQGCDKHFVITTKPEGFVRKPANRIVKLLMRIFYRKYPAVLRDYKVRHINYKKQMDLIQSLVEENKALLMRPSKTIEISRFKGDTENLQKLYDLGYQDMEARKEEILEFIKKGD